jgi:hypothetical protein
MDPLDDLRDPGVSALFRGLTSDPTWDELAGERAALTMFRSVYEQPATVRSHRRRWRFGGRLGAAGTVVAMVGGFTAAAYAQALPAPVQHAAHQVLGWAGIPNSGPPPAHAAATGPHPKPHRGGSASVSPGSRSHRPGSSGKASHSHGKSHRPKSPGAHVGPLSVKLVLGKGRQPDLLLVTVPGAGGFFIELQRYEGGTWRKVQTHKLHKNGQTEFTVQTLKISVNYRVVLLHTAEIGGPYVVPAGPHSRGHGNNGQGVTG